MSSEAQPISNTTQVRPMAPADLPAALGLWSEAEGVSVSEGDSIEELKEYLALNPGSSQVAYEGEHLVGAILAGSDGRRGYLYHLAVGTSQRGRGLGRILVEKALESLRAKGIKRVLILVASDNHSGRAFWSHCGWEGMEFAQPMGFDL